MSEITYVGDDALNKLFAADGIVMDAAAARALLAGVIAAPPAPPAEWLPLVPGAAGEFGVYPSHQPALIMLGGGALSYQGIEDNGEIFIRGGVAEVSPDTLLILTDFAVMSDEVDREDAEALLAEVEASVGPDDVLDDARVRKIATSRGYAEAVLKVAGH